MPNYVLQKNFLFSSSTDLKNKIIQLSTQLVFNPISQYQLNDDQFFVWEFTTFVGRKAYYQCQFNTSNFVWRYGSAWNPATKVLDGQVNGSSISLSIGGIIDICICRNIDMFGIFLTIDSIPHSSVILLPQVFDNEIWDGMDLYFGNNNSRNPAYFVSGKLNKLKQYQQLNLSYCGTLNFSLPNLAGNIPVLAGLFLIAEGEGQGFLAGFSGNTGICASNFLRRFSTISDASDAAQAWLILYQSNGGLVIRA
jgi:hypothetical protein